MGVYVRPDSPWFWLLLERDGQKPIRKKTDIHHTTSTPKMDKENRRRADIAYYQAMAKLSRGQLGMDAPTAPTLSTFWADTYLPWLTKHYPKAVKETTRRMDTHFLTTLGPLPMTQITPALIRSWLEDRSDVTQQTAMRDLNDLRGVLTKAVEWETIPTHPLGTLSLPPAASREIIRYLTADEETRLMTTLTARDEAGRAARERANRHRLSRRKAVKPAIGHYLDALHPLVTLSLQTGMRRGEVFQLKWSAIDWQAKVVTVEWWTQKRNRRAKPKTRRIPLNTAAIDALERWRDQTKKTGLIFPGKDGQPLENTDSSWETLLTAAAIEDFRWHDLRHTFASKLVQRGVDLYVVSKLLGHASIQTTMRYAHLAPDQGRIAVDLLTLQSREPIGSTG